MPFQQLYRFDYCSIFFSPYTIIESIQLNSVGIFLTVLLAFSQAKNVKLAFFRAKIDSVAHCKLSIAAPLTTNLSKLWPLSLGHLQ